MAGGIILLALAAKAGPAIARGAGEIAHVIVITVLITVGIIVAAGITAGTVTVIRWRARVRAQEPRAVPYRVTVLPPGRKAPGGPVRPAAAPRAALPGRPMRARERCSRPHRQPATRGRWS